MKIVVLDGYSLNPGDLSWDGIEKFGALTVYDRTNKDEILKRALDADIIFTNKTVIDSNFIENAKKLKYIGVLATGYNVVDIEKCREKDIVVTNVPTYSTNAVAQFVFALILEIAHGVGEHNRAVKRGEWANSIDFCFWKTPLMELSGKTIGIVGFGKIGQATAKLARAFGMNVIVNTRTVDKSFEDENLKFVDLDELLRESDFVSLHCPLFEETKGMINKKSLNKMKKTAYLINTSRGQLINDLELAEALNNNVIAGAALDVLSQEPPKEDNPLIKAKNIIITPHIAWAPFEARKRLMDVAVDNLKKFIDGKTQNIVS